MICSFVTVTLIIFLRRIVNWPNAGDQTFAPVNQKKLKFYQLLAQSTQGYANM
jgi:hypothetical protein